MVLGLPDKADFAIPIPELAEQSSFRGVYLNNLLLYRSNSALLQRSLLKIFLLCLLFLNLSKVSLGQASSSLVEKETVVTPLPTEDINGPCYYFLKIPQGKGEIRGVWLIFDRGRDVHDLASDPDVLTFARRFDLALLLQSHCPGKLAADHEDMNMEPAEGLGPSLWRALDQFAQETNHPELSKADLLLLGFSGAGPLTGRFIAEYPNRIIAGVLSAPGHFPPQGINTVKLNRNAQQIPELIIAGGADDRSGTRLPYEYFRKYRQLGAPWTFVVQNRSPHCCTANVKLLMLDWLSAVLNQRMPSRAGLPLRQIADNGSWLGFIHTEPTSIQDAFHFNTFDVTNAEIRRAKAREPGETQDASWLPNALVAREWLSFVEQKSHPILPLR
jgi:pimeloyl-ACP methyl ester carboxylesterase